MADKYKYIPLFLLMITSDFRIIDAENVYPKNTAGFIDYSLELNCTYERSPSEKRSVQWAVSALNSPSTNIIYQGGDVMDEFTSDYAKGSTEDNIIIKRLRYGLAGGYSCSSTDGNPVVKTDIQVAGTSQVRCSRNSEGAQEEGDTPTLSCAADISANSRLEPSFKWFRNGEAVDGHLVTPTTSPTPGMPETVTYIHNFTVTSDDHEVPFECRMGFRYVTSTKAIDDSDPDFEQSCSLSFQVLFGPKDVRIEPSSSDNPNGYITVEVGDRLNCTAKGTEPLTFEWRQINGEIYQPGQYLEITSEMLDYNEMVFNCTVTNNINQQPRTGTDQVVFFAIPSSAVSTIYSALSMCFIAIFSIISMIH